MNKVLCSIVTYNRLSCLRKCISCLKKQSYKSFDILVINNGCEDGTQEWLATQKSLFYINQYPNIGCAGGVYLGMQYAYTKGYDWIWLMDDDGEPEANQLKELLAGANNNDLLFVNSLVCDIANPHSLAFGLNIDGGKITSVAEAERYDIISSDANPWNGTLISKRVIEQIGFVKKEMMLWGEEVEYSSRAKAAGIPVCTITKAIHYHPKARNHYERVFPFSESYLVQIPNKERQAIVFRNMGYNRRYGRKRGTIYLILLYIIYYSLRFNFIGLYHFIKYFRQGLKDKYPKVKDE